MHLFSRNDTIYSIYATSSYENGLESALSEGLAIEFIYDSVGCTEQTVPVADAGEDQIVQVGSEVTLDGTGSYDPYDPDTAGLFYVWQCYSAPESSVTLSDDGKNSGVTFIPTVTGNYYFRLSIRDQHGGGNFNRSAVAYVRVSAVDDPGDPDLLNANAGRTKQAQVGEAVTLDGSLSVGPVGTTYEWEHLNPIAERDLTALAPVFGADGCTGECYTSNFDGDADVDGSDLAALASNWGPVTITDDDQPIAQFEAGIARPYIFRLSINNGINTSSETAIVAVNHPNVSEVLTPPPVDEFCLTP
jgi:hypothetical protein